MRILLKDHARFQESVAWAALASAAACLVGIFLPAWGAVAVMVLLVGVALRLPRTADDAAWLLLLACWAGGLSQARWVPGWAAPLAGAGALAVLLAREVGGLERW